MNSKKIISLLFVSLFLFACQPAADKTDHQTSLPVIKTPERRSESLLHTVVQLSIYHKDQGEAMDEALAYIEDMENLLSTTIEGSDVDRINKAAGQEAVKVDKRTFEVIELAVAQAKASQGKFDISIGAVTNLWQIGSEKARVPEASEIEAALPHIDYRRIQLDKEKQTVRIEEGMALELGAISKGYIADQVKALFRKRGISTAIINLGGNVVVMGTSPKNEDGWQVGVQDPDSTRGATVGAVPVTDRSIVTSGIYERYLEDNGNIYHHIMDPETGYPVDNNISGVTVFTKESVQGDALSTTLFLLGIEEGLAYVEKLDDVEVVYIDKDHGVHISQGLRDKFELTNKEYHLAN